MIDIVYKYRCDTPESFSKAFRRFHGITPSQVKKQNYSLQFFQRLIIKIKNDVADKFVVEEILALEWAIFKCVGPMPGALQEVNQRI